MTKIFSAKCWITLISACGVGGGIALACSDWGGEEYGVSNFSPEIFVDSTYSPFFYSSQYYYKINYDDNQHTRFNDKNITEWAGFLNNAISNDELQYLLQKAGPGTIDSAFDYVSGKSGAIPAALRSLAVLKHKKDKQLNAFFSYLQLAKKSEAFALNDIQEAWNIDTSLKKTIFPGAAELNRSLQNAFAKTNEPFLKERYWFQLVRSYFFNGSPEQATVFFNNAEKNMPHNNMYFRTLAYSAGAYKKLKNYSKANYYYSLVYEGCNDLKTAAHYSFHPQEEKDWNATLAMCRNNEERATLWQMLGIFYADEQRAINEIYLLNPASNKLDLLLGRAVNKYEQKFSYRGDSPMYLTVDTLAMNTLPALITKIADAGNAGKPWIWQMAAGYLNMLDERYTMASGWYTKAAKTIPAEKSVAAQLRLLKLINKVGQAKRIDSKMEDAVLNDIEWLKNFDGKTIPELRYSDAFAWLKQKMAAKYLAQKEWVKSECFSSSTLFYTSNNRVESLKTFLDKPAKTAYEKLCADLCVKKTEDLFEYQAIRLTYTDSLAEAIAKMEKAGSGAAIELPGNPFNGRIQDCHDCDHAAVQKIKYTKLSLLTKLQEIKQKINAGVDVYNNAMLLANVHYNISHFGNARVFYESKILGSDQSDPFTIDSLFRKMLTGMSMATKYYKLCLQNAATDEQKAKCQYMLSKCQRNQWYVETIYNIADNRYSREAENLPDFIAWDGFKALKQYAGTQYYKEIIKECGYFNTYTKKNAPIINK